MADRNTNFTWIDVAIIVGYLAMLVAIGVYFSRRQKGIESFFLAGRRMGWLPIGLSLMAALNSGIDYVAGPSTIFKFGLIFTAGALSWVFLYPWVAYVSLPFYRRLQTVSAYEYLERRFNVGVRILAACIFLLWRIGWMGTAMYVPALAIEAITAGRIPTAPLHHRHRDCRNGLHDAWRHSGRHLDRCDPVLHHADRRRGGDRSDPLQR
jgi:Na+/proline symporter